MSRAADRYGVSDAQLRAMLKADPSLRVSGAGLYYVDPAPAKKKVTEPTVIGQAFPLCRHVPAAQQAGLAAHDLPGLQRPVRQRHLVEHVAGGNPR